MQINSTFYACESIFFVLAYIRPLQVVILFLVLDFSKDHVGGWYISIIASTTRQSDLLGTLTFVIKYSCVTLHMPYTNY